MIEAEAKALLAATLDQLGIEQAPVCAVWLTRDGYVVGRRFECGPIHAVCFLEENEVKIYDQDGKLLRVSARTTTTGKAA